MSNATQGEWLTQTSPADNWYRSAWIAVVLIPIFFILAFAVGQGLYTAAVLYGRRVNSHV